MKRNLIKLKIFFSISKNMKKIFFVLFILSFSKLVAQSYEIDTLVNAKSYTNSFIPISIFGKTSNGHIYTCGIINNYSTTGTPLPITLVRIDLTSKSVLNKSIEGTRSSSSILWASAFDSTGTFYLGLNSLNRKIFRFNLKDSIDYKNLGNGFKNGSTLAYSMSLGCNGNMYFGGSSGDPYVSEYNPYKNKIIEYPSIDEANDYVLTIAGDTNFIYAQTGQRNSIQLWAMKKSDSTKHLLFKIPNNTRMNMSTTTDGIFVSFHCDTLKGNWKMVDGNAVACNGKTGNDIRYFEINNPNFPPTVISNFDAVQTKLFYSINKSFYQNISINSGKINTNIRAVFGFQQNDTNIYYAGDYYGNYYKYNVSENVSTLLGNTTFNIYSVLKDTDSTIYFGNYPSGALLKWNRNLPWTLNKFINNTIVLPGRNSNPHLIGYFKSETPAGFHHLSLMIRDFKGNIVCAGDVIRIGNTCSIGVYNPLKDSIYGYDFNKIKGLASSGLAAWKNFIIFSTNNFYGGIAKLYFYSSTANKMIDSVDLGFADYGKIYTDQNFLIGVANDRIYKLNLTTKQLQQNFSYKKNSIIYSQQLSDGTIIIHTQNTLPNFYKFVNLPYTSYFEDKHTLYAISGNNLLRVKKFWK